MTEPVAADDRATQLLEAFASFSEVSTSLENAYNRLQEKARHLGDQLEQTSYYLASVLESLPCGVVVFDKDQQVTAINDAGREMLGLPPLTVPMPLSRLSEAADLPVGAQLARLLRQPDELEIEFDLGRTLRFAFSRMRDSERIMVIQDVTEMRNLEKEVRTREAVLAMGEMALEVAHEIRSPLASLELFAELLGEEEVSQPQRRRYAQNMQIGVRSLNAVVSNMLAFSRTPQPSLQAVSIRELLKELIDFMRPLLEKRDIRVIQQHSDCPMAEGDPEMLRQVFTNLIANALQALPQGGELGLTTRSAEEGIQILVRDNGIGMSESVLKRIFEPRFTTSQKGNGLGLAIVHRAIESLGGTIQVKSRPSQGTEFAIWLSRWRGLCDETGSYS